MTANQSRHRPGPSQNSDIMALVPEKGIVGFQYRPLDPTVNSTSLIAFEPVEDENDTVRCKLIHVTFGETPKYEALSYTWGDEKIKEIIFVDGKEFLVGQNLWGALRVLRKRLDGQRYWIDAICLYLDRNRAAISSTRPKLTLPQPNLNLTLPLRRFLTLTLPQPESSGWSTLPQSWS
jgi:hypothetical protein